VVGQSVIHINPGEHLNCGAKRSALHGAEHSSKLSHVMAGGSWAARTMTDLLPEPEQ
jgi:hypothetical protein